MNGPSLAHRSSGKELPTSFDELLDTVTLATERIRAIALLVNQQLEDQPVSSSVLGICLDVITQEANDLNAWLQWWLEQDRKKVG